jgi:cyclohexanone monooxygenase
VAEQVFVLQRTPNYSMPARNRPLDEREWQQTVDGFAERRRQCEESDSGVPLRPPTTRAVDAAPEERLARYEAGWTRGGISALSMAFTDMFVDERSNTYAQDFARDKIRSTVRDPDVAAALCPTHHIGTKRTCVDTDYFETYNRDNVELVDLRSAPILEITPDGIRTASGDVAVDVIVFAVGFDAITGALSEIDIRGRGGRRLAQEWAAGPRTLLGIQTAGFPNLFLITGPGSPSVLSNMVVSIEQHVDWIADCLQHLRRSDLDTIEPSPQAQAQWMAHVDALAQATLYPRARSWYVGANIPGKPREFSIYVAGCGNYRRECDEIVAAGYAGFLVGRHGTESRHGTETTTSLHGDRARQETIA